MSAFEKTFASPECLKRRFLGNLPPPSPPINIKWHLPCEWQSMCTPKTWTMGTMINIYIMCTSKNYSLNIGVVHVEKLFSWMKYSIRISLLLIRDVVFIKCFPSYKDCAYFKISVLHQNWFCTNHDKWNSGKARRALVKAVRAILSWQSELSTCSLSFKAYSKVI